MLSVLTIAAQEKTAILVKTEPGVKIFINDSLVGQTIANHKDLIVENILPGKKRLLLVKPGALPQYSEIEVNAGEVSIVYAEPFISQRKKKTSQKVHEPEELLNKVDDENLNFSKIVLLPQALLKVGSQSPKYGAELGLELGKFFSESLLIGIGSGYRSSLGTGEYAIPLFAGTRYFISQRNLTLGGKVGITFNKSNYYKNSYFAAVGLGYRIMGNNIKLPAPLYVGIDMEFNHTPFYQDFREFVLHDGYLQQLIIGFKVTYFIHFNKKSE